MTPVGSKHLAGIIFKFEVIMTVPCSECTYVCRFWCMGSMSYCK